MNMTDINTIPLDQIDVSRPELYHHDVWHPWFARLRKEAPVHYQAESDQRTVLVGDEPRV